MLDSDIDCFVSMSHVCRRCCVLQVLYSDGDKEDLTLKEVRATLVEGQTTPKTKIVKDLKWNKA